MPAVILSSTEGMVGMQPSMEIVRAGGTPLDALEAGIRVIEQDPSVRSVGFGGAPDLTGEMSCDASIMDGDTLRAGAVGALRGFRYPITIARAVMEQLPHVLMVDTGACRFADEIGAERGEMLSDEARTAWESWFKKKAPQLAPSALATQPLIPLIETGKWHDLARGTTNCLILDSKGRMAGGVSTSAWPYRYPGRLGDSPIIGAGLYVDSRYGAASCTHTGEMTIRAGTARSVVLYLKRGATVREAVCEAHEDLKSLKGGYLGALIIHAVDKDGEVAVMMNEPLKTACYWVWREGEEEYSRGIPEVHS